MRLRKGDKVRTWCTHCRKLTVHVHEGDVVCTKCKSSYELVCFKSLVATYGNIAKELQKNGSVVLFERIEPD